jgi:hypothetical protein
LRRLHPCTSCRITTDNWWIEDEMQAWVVAPLLKRAPSSRKRAFSKNGGPDTCATNCNQAWPRWYSDDLIHINENVVILGLHLSRQNTIDDYQAARVALSPLEIVWVQLKVGSARRRLLKIAFLGSLDPLATRGSSSPAMGQPFIVAAPFILLSSCRLEWRPLTLEQRANFQPLENKTQTIIHRC